jgi:hypothetical protein
MPCPSHLSDLDMPVLYGEACLEITKLITMKFPSTSCQSPLLSPNILLKYPQSLCTSFNVRHQGAYAQLVGTYI